MVKTKVGDASHVVEVISRATMLLRLATGASATLLSDAGIERERPGVLDSVRGNRSVEYGIRMTLQKTCSTYGQTLRLYWGRLTTGWMGLSQASKRYGQQGREDWPFLESAKG